MRFHHCLTFTLLALVLGVLTHSGSAQDASEFGADDLIDTVHSQDLDSFWLDQKKWMAYGYRPQLKANITPWSKAPSYFAGHDSYSYGSDMPAPNLNNPLNKKTVQLTKYGTWH